MKLSIDQVFEHSYVISIDKKQLDYFYTVINRCGLPETKIQFFHGRTDASTGTLNCTNSHLDILKKARDNGWDMVTVFEDDTFPSNRYDIETFQSYLDNIPDDAVGICYSRSRGDFSKYKQKYIDSRIHKPRLSASNFYTLFKTGYDEVIKRLEQKRAADIAINIDRLYYTRDNLFVQCSYGNRMSNWSIVNPKFQQEIWCSQFLDRHFYELIYKKQLGKINIQTKIVSEELKEALTSVDGFVYRFNGGNMGDALIGYSDLQTFDSMNLKYCIVSKQNKAELLSKPFNLVYGGGGGWIDKYLVYGRKQADAYFKNKNLKRCVILPSTFYRCDEIVNTFDERFIVFCRDYKSLEYCKSINSKAKFLFHDDLAFCGDISKLNLNNLCGITDRDLISKLHTFMVNNSQKCNLYRNDMEKTDVVLPKNNLDISEMRKKDGEDMTREYVRDITRVLLYVIDKFYEVSTNRLHVAIASYRLSKKINMSDNSYGKVRNIYESSMKDYPGAVFN